MKICSIRSEFTHVCVAEDSVLVWDVMPYHGSGVQNLLKNYSAYIFRIKAVNILDDEDTRYFKTSGAAHPAT